ncbi:MAG: hypothetical protein CM15mP8_3750 [Methanobacteriota archaeon]|nr:MAG: hypothetical protein CM15mP8_3750 [Euryarchaeota archaeon]
MHWFTLLEQPLLAKYFPQSKRDSVGVIVYGDEVVKPSIGILQEAIIRYLD